MDSIRDRMVKFSSRDDKSVMINATQGHFATSQSHINYYIDVTRMKVRVKEAEEAAKSLKVKLLHHVDVVDSIVCLDGTELIAGFLAQEIEASDFHMTNRHETMYVAAPEENSIHQFMFRENIRPAIEGKNVLVMVATMTTGETVRRSMECIEYYGGTVKGIIAIFSTMQYVNGIQVYSLFDQQDFPGYATFAQLDCPYCRRGIPIEAMVNGYGYAKL